MKRTGTNQFGGKQFFVPGEIQLFDFSSDHITSLDHFDTIIDMDGQGATIYVHRCPGCRDIFYMKKMAQVVLKCPACYAVPFVSFRKKSSV
tara:strand:- start:2106 stop:2378 length:273 start_codon:yes stop_codon:yes gene_type:complete